MFVRSAFATWTWWSNLPLTRQFVFLSSVFVAVALGGMGIWVSAKIEDSIKLNAATRGNLYVASFIAPYLQELADSNDLNEQNVAEIDAEVHRDRGFLQLTEARVWNLKGRVVYSTRKSLVGAVFPVTESLSEAASGTTAVEFDGDDHVSADHPSSENPGAQLEIYVPVRAERGGQVIAIAELYQHVQAIRDDISKARFDTWGIVGFVSVCLLSALYLIVARGARTIARQGLTLASQIDELKGLLQQNSLLRSKAASATQRAAAASEIQLRNIGADLHDGVGQLLTIVLLKLDQLFDGSEKQSQDYAVIRGMLEDAMTEIRNMSAGIALPEIGELSLAEAIELIIERHERRTSTRVAVDLRDVDVDLSEAKKLCVCRFLQEGLSNAYRHAGGEGQVFAARVEGPELILSLSDRGRGIGPSTRPRKRPALGLAGLEVRFESLGGRLVVASEAGKGTQLKGILPLGEGDQRHV